MRKFYLWVLTFLITHKIYSQKLVVVNASSLQPVTDAFIYNSSQSISAITNEKGIAYLKNISDKDTLFVQALGYYTLTVGNINKNTNRILLYSKGYSLNEVVVGATKFNTSRKKIPHQAVQINAKEMSFINQPTSADVLQNTGQVLVQKSQLGGGSPVMRGFEANKVLMVVDGVRMNNAIYRGGHLQNSITVDNNMLESMDLVFGPSSVIYGSDALGGVIHFTTKNPEFNTDTAQKILIKVGAFTRYASASNEKTGHIDFNFGKKKWGFLSSFNFSNFDDLRKGHRYDLKYGSWGERTWYVKNMDGKDSIFINKDKDIQVGTAYKQYDVLQKILYKQNNKVSHLLNFQFSNSSNVPRYDRLTLANDGKPKFSEWYYGPQKRLFGSYSLLLTSDKGIYNKGRIIAGFQQIEESRHDRGFNNTKLNNRIENLMIFSINADFEKIIHKHEFRYGSEIVYNDVKSEAFALNKLTGEKNPIDTRYPDGGSQTQSAALYFTHTFNISSKLIISEGIRASQNYLRANFNDKTFFNFPFDAITQQNYALCGNVGLVYLPSEDWKFSVLVANGFRAPNVDDLAKVFESLPGILIVPNPDLKPENSYNADIGISKSFNNNIRLECNGFYSIYRDVITLQDFTFQGKDFILYNGVNSRVKSSVNASKAYIYGNSFSFIADVNKHFTISNTFNYTYGRIKTDTTDYPLDHIPPVFGKTSFMLNLNKFKADLFLLYNGWKRIKNYNMVGEDNFMYATPLGTPAWFTLNIRTSYAISSKLQLQASVENLLDQHYRVFSSGISAPGRNVMATLRLNL